MTGEHDSTDPQTRRRFLKRSGAVAGAALTGLGASTGTAAAGGSFKSATWRGINQGNKGLIVVDVGDVAVADSFNNWEINVLSNLLVLNVSDVEVVDESTVKVLTNSLNDNEIAILSDNEIDIRVSALCSCDGKKYYSTCTA